MRKINIAFLLLMVVAVFMGCEKKERAFIEYENLEHGAYPRLIDGINGSFDFFSPAESTIDFTVEFYDDQQGELVDSYSWTVSYVDQTTGIAGAPADILTVNRSQFGRSDFGLPSAMITFSLQQALDALGLTTADINGGDAIRFNGTITLSDGRQFTANNTGPNVISQFPFAALFRFDQTIVCPSNLEGTFDVKTTDAWCGEAGPYNGESTWEQVAPGTYEITMSTGGDPDFSYGAYDLCYGPGSARPGGDLKIQDACGTISPTGTSQWGEVYTFESVSTDGPTLTIVWTNDYGEGGTVMLTRQDGMNWPPLTN